MEKNSNWSLLTIIMVAVMSVCFTSCGSDGDDVVPENPIDTSNIILFVDDTKVIEGDITTSKTENDFIVSIKNNKITANHVGETKVVVNEKYTIPVTVMPKFMIMYSEPILDWGISKEEVKSRWKQGTLNEKDNVLAYNDCGDAALVAYGFKDGKLGSVTIAVPESKGIKFTNYLTERFLIVPYEVDDKYVGYDAYTLKSAKTSLVYDISGGYKVGSKVVYLCTFIPANKE